MKRTVAFIIAAVIFLCQRSNVMAAQAVSVTAAPDYTTGITTVSADVGAAYADRRVNVIILNPGFSLSDLQTKSVGAVNWADQTYVGEDGMFSIDMAIKTSEEIDAPTYTAVAAVDGLHEVLTTTFELFNAGYVEGVLQRLWAALAENSAEKICLLLEEYAKLFDIYDSEAFQEYMAFDAETKARAARGMVEEAPESTTDVKRAFIAVIGAIKLDDITNPAEYEAALASYVSMAAASVQREFSLMTDTNKRILIESLMEMSFASSAGMINALNQRFVLDAVNSAELWTEAAAVYLKYADVLKIDTAAYQALKDKKTPVSSLMHREYQTIERAAEAFDRAVEDQKKRERVSGSGGTGGAGGAGGKGGGQAGVTGPAPTPVPVPESEEKEQVFKDLAGYEWAERDISTLAEAGIVNGCGEGVFAPAEPITRAEFTKIFVSAFGICAGDADLQFEDVRQGDWFYESVKSAYAAGYMKGVDSRRFAPDAMITREDMAVALCRYLNVAGGSLVDFADADAISDYAKDAVVSLAEAGMINGYEDHTFRPQAGASRAETAVLFARILKEKGEL